MTSIISRLDITPLDITPIVCDLDDVRPALEQLWQQQFWLRGFWGTALRAVPQNP
ncbi:MAG TPA: hypothetical protein IGS37_12435 [Synechococcales cyanobacterium M55_K2018_004]|nr:hypothetical protein [Synechococcales cyanobacterium M55_K2018_004]